MHVTTPPRPTRVQLYASLCLLQCDGETVVKREGEQTCEQPIGIGAQQPGHLYHSRRDRAGGPERAERGASRLLDAHWQASIGVMRSALSGSTIRPPPSCPP